MFNITQKERHIWSREIPSEQAAGLTSDLLLYWYSKKLDGNIPLKSNMHPWDFKKNLGRICILDVKNDPIDFVYRLAGTFIDEGSGEYLNHQSILSAQPAEFAKVAFMDLLDTFNRKEPILWEAEVHHFGYETYTRLVLPLSLDGNRVDFLMTYSHCLSNVNGDFPINHAADTSSTMFVWPKEFGN